MKKTDEEIIELANTLSNNEICTLLNLVSLRLDVYVGTLGGLAITTSVDSVTLNGTGIQINTALSQLDDMSENGWFRRAMNDGI